MERWPGAGGADLLDLASMHMAELEAQAARERLARISNSRRPDPMPRVRAGIGRVLIRPGVALIGDTRPTRARV